MMPTLRRPGNGFVGAVRRVLPRFAATGASDRRQAAPDCAKTLPTLTLISATGTSSMKTSAPGDDGQHCALKLASRQRASSRSRQCDELIDMHPEGAPRTSLRRPCPEWIGRHDVEMDTMGSGSSRVRSQRALTPSTSSRHSSITKRHREQDLARATSDPRLPSRREGPASTRETARSADPGILASATGTSWSKSCVN